MPLAQLSRIKTEIARVIGGSGFLFVCRIAGAVLTFVTQVLLARWMGATELGAYVLAFSWLTLLSVIPVGGYNAAAVRFIGQGLADEHHGYARGYIRHAARIIAVSSIGIALLAITVIALYPGLTVDTRKLLMVAIVGVPFYAYLRLNNGTCMASSQFALGYLPNNIVRPTVFLAVIALFWLLDVSLDSDITILAHVATIGALAVATTMLTRQRMNRLLSPAPPENESSRWNRVAISLLGVTLFTNYFQQITVIVTGFFLPKADIGIYNVAYRIAMLISFTLVAVDAFTAPALSRYYQKGQRAELVRELQYSTALRFGISMTAVTFMIFFGEWVLSLFGTEFTGAYAMTMLMALAQLAYAAVGPVTRLLGITGHHKHSMYASAGALVLWLLLTAVLLPAYGILGVSIAVFLALTGWAFTLRHFVIRYLGIDILVVVRDRQRPADFAGATEVPKQQDS